MVLIMVFGSMSKPYLRLAKLEKSTLLACLTAANF